MLYSDLDLEVKFSDAISGFKESKSKVLLAKLTGVRAKSMPKP